MNASYLAGALSDHDYRVWATDQLRRVLALAQNGSPFYAARLAGIDPATFELSELEQLPFTTKDDLREQMLDMLSRDLDDACFFYETTGTTGPATPCPRDAREVLASNAHLTESWRNIFGRHFPGRRPRIGAMVPTEVHSSGDTLGDVARNLDSMIVKIWPYSPVIGYKKALELMHRLELDVIFCVPSVAMTLARAAHFYGYDPAKDFAAQVFLVTGELCTPALARQIDQAWNVTTYNALYGAQESLIISSACANGRMHLARPNYIHELRDPETGALSGPYGTGELVVTMLIEGSKPLIRYRTGDVVEIGANDCGCGIVGPLIRINGRIRDQVQLGANRFRAWRLEEAVLRHVEACLGYQVEIERDEHGRDRLRVRLDAVDQPSVAAGRADSERLARLIGAELGVPVGVEWVTELDPVTTTGAFVSWKAAKLKDLRAEPDREDQAAALLAVNRDYRT
ncbi:phenylacetate--CoA ligase family protein [Nocardia sp. NPDC127579]|uniref:phenylacetate--CoA ligase family protein n=1 Tax=Nocardia sp. NPDC127579 TaxID=3345402 RepID=UPI003637FD56